MLIGPVFIRNNRGDLEVKRKMKKEEEVEIDGHIRSR